MAASHTKIPQPVKGTFPGERPLASGISFWYQWMRMQLRLYHYWRSSGSWRVRWALALKGIPCEFVAVDLLKGEQSSEEHLRRNPLGRVPVLAIADGRQRSYLAESLAILEWLEETCPKPTLLPKDPWGRAIVRQMAHLVASGIQPLQNLGTMRFYSDDQEKQREWSRHWIQNGLQAYESLTKQYSGKYSFGEEITLADLCLIPQCYNALRFDVTLEEYPTVEKIYEAVMKTEACQASAPDRFQP